MFAASIRAGIELSESVSTSAPGCKSSLCNRKPLVTPGPLLQKMILLNLSLKSPPVKEVIFLIAEQRLWQIQ
jgi:hypothetical protein